MQKVPLLPRPASILARLVCLSLEVFDRMCTAKSFHPASEFRAIVRNAASLILPSLASDLQNTPQLDDFATQSLLELMNGSGVEWPGNVFDAGTELNGWDINMGIN